MNQVTVALKKYKPCGGILLLWDNAKNHFSTPNRLSFQSSLSVCWSPVGALLLYMVPGICLFSWILNVKNELC